MFTNVPTEVGATDAEEIGGYHPLSTCMLSVLYLAWIPGWTCALHSLPLKGCSSSADLHASAVALVTGTCVPLIPAHHQAGLHTHSPHDFGMHTHAVCFSAAGVEHLLRDVKDSTVGTLATEMSRMVHGIHGLKSRLLEIQQYLQYVMEGKLPVNHDIMYQLQVKNGSACHQAIYAACCLQTTVLLWGLQSQAAYGAALWGRYWQLLPHASWLVHTAALAAGICSWHKLKLRISCPEWTFDVTRAAALNQQDVPAGCASHKLTPSR